MGGLEMDPPSPNKAPSPAEGQRSGDLKACSTRDGSLEGGLPWLEAGPQEALLLPPTGRLPSNAHSLPFALSLFSALQQSGPFWKGKRMGIPRIGDGAPGAKDRASHLQGEQPSISRAPAGNPRSHPPLTPGPQTPSALRNPLPQASQPPGASGSPAFPSYTFWELKDWVQWYRTRLSLGQWAGLAASGVSWASAGLAASLSSAEMGHQLQLVGVKLLGVAMTARNPRAERRRFRQRLALSRPASHGLAEPAPLLRSLPPLSVNVISHWASEGGSQGIPGGPSLRLPLARPWPVRDKPPVLSVASVEGCAEPERSGVCPPGGSWLASCLPMIPPL